MKKFLPSFFLLKHLTFLGSLSTQNKAQLNRTNKQFVSSLQSQMSSLSFVVKKNGLSGLGFVQITLTKFNTTEQHFFHRLGDIECFQNKCSISTAYEIYLYSHNKSENITDQVTVETVCRCFCTFCALTKFKCMIQLSV